MTKIRIQVSKQFQVYELEFETEMHPQDKSFNAFSESLEKLANQRLNALVMDQTNNQEASFKKEVKQDEKSDKNIADKLKILMLTPPKINKIGKPFSTKDNKNIPSGILELVSMKPDK